MVKLKCNYEGIIGEPCIGFMQATDPEIEYLAQNTLGEFVKLDSHYYDFPESKEVYLIENEELIERMYPHHHEELYQLIEDEQVDVAIMSIFASEDYWKRCFIVVPNMEKFLSDINKANAIIFHECGHIIHEQTGTAEAEILADGHAVNHNYGGILLNMIETNFPVLLRVLGDLRARIEYYRRVRSIKKKMGVQ